MPKRPGLLNVRVTLEFAESLLYDILEDERLNPTRVPRPGSEEERLAYCDTCGRPPYREHKKASTSTVLCPSHAQAARELHFIIAAILRNHHKKRAAGNRKDVYIGV